MPRHPLDRPLLIYDGDCGFCKYSVRYWQRLTGDSVRYAPYQAVAPQFPEISIEDFQRAIQLVRPSGGVVTGARAAFEALKDVPGKAWGLNLYRRIPGFAPLAEVIYEFIARHREGFHWLSRRLWGSERYPPEYRLVSWVWLRLLALIFLAAFTSFGIQAIGLIGADGITPVASFLETVALRLPDASYRIVPTVFWLNASDTAIYAVIGLGIAAALALFFNVLPRVCLVLLYVLYLSLLYAGQVFMIYQWDILLVECGFLAIFLSFNQRLFVWLYRWLLFRFMFLSGAVKLLSGDSSWADFSALDYHFQTQPLPTPLAYYAHNLPETVLHFAVGATFFIELLVPFMFFLPRRPRMLAAWLTIGLELLIALTGNYNFFNLLTIGLCLFLFDDQALERLLPRSLVNRIRGQRVVDLHRTIRGALVSTVAALLVVLGVLQMWVMFARGNVPEPVRFVLRGAQPLRIVNNYGLFSVMTKVRNEIIIEGSADGRTWLPYEFKYKPGELDRAPTWLIPHQPRLDWQMWFAALGDVQRNAWFQSFVVKLLQNNPAVTALLERNPFPETPPRYLRAKLYTYEFADTETRARTGQWWTREFARAYLLPISLEDITREREPGIE